MTLMRQLATQACRGVAALPPHGVAAPAAAVCGLSRWYSCAGVGGVGGTCGGPRRRFSSAPDPYKALGVGRNASDAEIKKAYRDQALRWHPDKNPDNKEEAQKRFSEASSAYEVLKDPATRQEYDQFGTVGGGGPQGPRGGPGGFQSNLSQAETERIFREAFGGHPGMAMDQLFQQLFQQMPQMHSSQGPPQHPARGAGGGGGAPGPRALQVGMEIQVTSSEAAIHKASRACGIDAENDARRARCAGKVGTIVAADPRDQSVKVRVMVTPGRADEVWFGAGAVQFLPEDSGPKTLVVGMEVQISPSDASIREVSRACGIGEENDGRRARCAGKVGTIVAADPRDQSVKVRVMVKPGRADEVWFGAGAVEPLPETEAPRVDPTEGPSAGGGGRGGGFASYTF